MTSLDQPESWTDGAVCATVDAELWYPEPGYHSGMAAKSVCASCDVIDACLNYALANHERWGIWGGLTPSERLEEARKRRLPYRACRVCLKLFHGIPTAMDCSEECRQVSRRRRDARRAS